MKKKKRGHFPTLESLESQDDYSWLDDPEFDDLESPNYDGDADPEPTYP